ncbi:MAG TPA: hypothetical protein VGS10_18810 [Terracidiphilus sp.]|nr:hypothetical protein [Terracidiphilus sp.]
MHDQSHRERAEKGGKAPTEVLIAAAGPINKKKPHATAKRGSETEAGEEGSPTFTAKKVLF